MVRPVTVTVTAVLAAIDWAAMVMTIWVLVGVATVPVGGPPPLICTPGVPVLEKKLDGYVSVMVPPAAIAPPAEVVKMKVAAAAVLLANRSADAIEKEVAVTCPPITPDAVPAEAVGSALVETVTAPPAVGVASIVMPNNVTVTAAIAAEAPVSNVITMLDAPLAAELASATPLNVTLGVTPTAKKLSGYISVTVLDTASAPPAVGVKLNVTGTFDKLAKRSESTILNATDVTAPPMYPDAVLTDTNRS